MRKCLCIFIIAFVLVSCNASPMNSNVQQGGDALTGIEDISLLYINYPAFTSGELYKFSNSNSYNVQNLQDYEARVISNIMLQYEIQFLSLSTDGSKALFETLDYPSAYKVFDLESKQVIFEFVIKDSDYDISMDAYIQIKFLPSLTKFIKITGDGCYLCSINGKPPIKLDGLNDIKPFNCVFSPDESMVAFVEETETDKYISIYDMHDKKIIRKVVIGEEGLFINQWHPTGKLLYNYNFNGYMIDIETEKVQDLGKYVFYPLLSPDGRYLAYSHTITFAYIDSMLAIDDTYEKTAGLYILDNNTNRTIKLDTDKYCQQVPIQWIDKDVAELIE